jgi:hypothetical protein
MTPIGRHAGVDAPPLRGVCLIVKGRAKHLERREPGLSAVSRSNSFPKRPDWHALSESIPLFFIARNKVGLWVAREAEGRVGGVFLFKRSALRFAQKRCAARGCATMILNEPFELDIVNQGGAAAARLDTILRAAGAFIPKYPPPIPVRRKTFIGDRP